MAGGLIDELFVALGFKVDDKEVKNLDVNLKAVIGSALRVVGAIAAATYAIDRMATSMFKTNQAFISFNQQTGLSIGNMQRIAQAGMLANANITPETVMQSMQAVQSNLAQIRLGQGNIEPYQLLGISPVGKDANQVFDDLRNAISGLDDMTATNIISQMGFNPEMITVLRMTNDELAQTQQLMLSPDQREALQQYQSELRKVNMEFGLLRDKALIAILPWFIKFMKGLEAMAEGAERLFNWTLKLVDGLGKFKIALLAFAIAVTAAFSPVTAAVWGLYLVLEDLAVWAMGGKSFFGTTFDIAGEKLKELGDWLGKGLAGAGSALNEAGKAFETFFSHLGSWWSKLPQNLQNFLGGTPGGKAITDMYNRMNQSAFATPSSAMDNAVAMNTPNAMANLNNQQTVNQNNYMSFGSTDAQPVAQKINDLAFAMMQVDRTA